MHGGFELNQADNYKKILLNNFLTGMKQLAEAAENISQENRKKARYLLGLDTEIEWNDELIEKMKTLWADEAIQKMWNARKETIMIQLDYLVENCDRFMQPDFVPTNDDILRARQRSTGETTWNFEDNHHLWNLLDVGGQLSERSKWEAIFKNEVHAVLFFLAIDEFDTPNPEPSKATTKFALAMSVFEEIMNSEAINKYKLGRIVFLNKIDLFKEKIKDEKRFSDFKKNLEYDGDQSCDSCTRFIEQKLRDKMLDDLPLHSHVICALDTEVMKTVMLDIKISIVTNSLRDMGYF